MRDIVGMVLGEGVRRTAVGIALGLAGALAASRAVRGMLYGVGATDPVDLRGRDRAARGRDPRRLPAARLARGARESADRAARGLSPARQ